MKLRKRIDLYLKKGKIEQNVYQHLIDWINSLNENDIDKFIHFTIEELINESNNWSIKVNNLKRTNIGTEKLVFSFNDYEVYHLLDNTAFSYEGFKLNHCLGTYKFHEGIYSLRKNGERKYTIEIVNQIINQIYGLKNSFVKKYDIENVNYIIINFFAKNNLVNSINYNVLNSIGYLRLTYFEKRLFELHFSNTKIIKLLDDYFIFKNNKVSIKKQFSNINDGNFKNKLLIFLSGENKKNLWENFWIHLILDEKDFNKIFNLTKYKKNTNYIEWYFSKKIEPNIQNIGVLLWGNFLLDENSIYGNFKIEKLLENNNGIKATFFIEFVHTFFKTKKQFSKNILSKIDKMLKMNYYFSEKIDKRNNSIDYYAIKLLMLGSIDLLKLTVNCDSFCRYKLRYSSKIKDLIENNSNGNEEFLTEFFKYFYYEEILDKDKDYVNKINLMYKD